MVERPDLRLDKSILTSSNYIDKVINALSEGSKNNKVDCYNDIRQVIADANIDDFDELFKSLYERASEYLPNKEGTVSILINEHQYKANFRIDKEINTMSLIQQILNNK
jgi:mitochondrial fission protein ELM1